MRPGSYLHMLTAFALLAPTVAHADTITVTVVNKFGQSVGNSQNTCTNGTCSPLPPTSIANGATSSAFGVVTGSGQYSPMLVTRWSAFKGGKEYGCSFQAATSDVGSSCGTPTVSANAYSGVYPSPTCKVTSQSPTPPSAPCNLTVTFEMSP